MKFEVRYKDKAIPEPTFMVVVRARNAMQAKRQVAAAGYQPIRIIKLDAKELTRCL